MKPKDIKSLKRNMNGHLIGSRILGSRLYKVVSKGNLRYSHEFFKTYNLVKSKT